MTLVEKCLKITGTFENGRLNYAGVTGNFDGQGVSVGALQFCAGQGSLKILLTPINAALRAQGIDPDSLFPGFERIRVASTLEKLSGVDAKTFCVTHFIKPGSTAIRPEAKAAWEKYLSTPESITTQNHLAEVNILAKAILISDAFVPHSYQGRERPLAFFFDLVTQSGGMKNKKGEVKPEPEGSIYPGATQAVALALQKHPQTGRAWNAAISNDPLARILLHYAYQRALLSTTEWQWNALVRRGTIACRVGWVNGAWFDLSSQID